MVTKKKVNRDFDDIMAFDENDITDSDDELVQDKRSLEKVRNKRMPQNFDSDDEVLGVQYDCNGDNDDDDDDDDDENNHDSMESDIERTQADDDLPDERAWGKKKKNYYSADYVDADYVTTNENDMEKAILEEEMARKIQQRLTQQLDDADFGLDLLPSSDSIKENKISDDKQIVKTDLSAMSKREKQSLFLKENPEFQALVFDFQDRLVEIKDVLIPFFNLIKIKNVAECPALNMMKIKYHLILNYSVNLSFYLELKAKKSLITSHPVIKRLAQLRQLLIQFEEKQGTLIKEASEILKAVENGQPLYNIMNNEQLKLKKVQKRMSSSSDLDLDKMKKRKISMKKSWSMFETVDDVENEEEAENDEMLIEEKTPDTRDDTSINNEEEITNGHLNTEVLDGEKRPINYKISKNKGLTPYRKKEQRNPRVKHRNKYRKAKIRRKGAVREVRKEIKRYDGEISGIKTTVMKSRKLK